MTVTNCGTVKETGRPSPPRTTVPGDPVGRPRSPAPCRRSYLASERHLACVRPLERAWPSAAPTSLPATEYVPTPAVVRPGRPGRPDRGPPSAFLVQARREPPLGPSVDPRARALVGSLHHWMTRQEGSSRRGREHHDHRQPHRRVARDPDRERRRLGGGVVEAAPRHLVLRPGLRRRPPPARAPSPISTATPDPALPRLPDRAAGRALHLPRGGLPPAERRAARRRPVRGRGATRSPTTPSSTRTSGSGSSRASTTTPIRWACWSRRSPRCRPSTSTPRTSSTPSPGNKQIIRLIAKMPTLAAAAHRFSVGMPFVYPDNSLDVRRQLPLHDVEGRPSPASRPTRSWPGRWTSCSSSTPTTSRTARPPPCGWSARPTPTPTRPPPPPPPPSTAPATAGPTRRSSACSPRSAPSTTSSLHRRR